MSKKRRNHSPEFKSKVALAKQGYEAGRKHVQRLMRLMGIEAIHPGPKTSKPHPQHKLYPYLLRDLKINRANHF